MGLFGMDWLPNEIRGAVDLSSQKVIVMQHWNIRDNRDVMTKPVGVVESISFPGLALFGQLPEQCFVTKDVMVTGTKWGTSFQIVRINVQNGTVWLVRRTATTSSADTTTAKLQLTSQELLCTTPSGGIYRTTQAQCIMYHQRSYSKTTL